MNRLRCLGVVGVLLIGSAPSIHAQVVPQADGQTVSVRAEGVSISTILSELTRLYPLETVKIDRDVLDHPVWVAIDNVSLRTALLTILKDSGLDFVVSGRRVVVSKSTVTATRAVGAATQVHPLSPDAAEPLRREALVREQNDAERQAADAEIGAALSAQQATFAADGDESTVVVMPPVRFIANGENITYLDPGYVPYKMRPHVRALRLATDVATIP